MGKRWNYSGDINLTYGGLFWREDGAKDYVNAIRVTPCSDAGGATNVYIVEQGSVYMPQDVNEIKHAIACCGYKLDKRGALIDGLGNRLIGKAKRALMVDAWHAYHGIERDTYNGETVIRIGSKEDCDGWNPEPDSIYRAGTRLKNIVRREFLKG